MLTIPYAGHTAYPADLVLRGAPPEIALVTALDSSHLTPFGRVYRGNAAADGSVTWSNITTAANSDTAGDVTLFDTANPTEDLLCIELDEGDELSGISLLLSTAAVITGVPVAEVFYRAAASWVTIPGVVTPSLTATGLVTVGFTLAASAVALTDDEIDRRNSPQHRCVFLRFSGITGVTTAPALSRVFKRLSHSVQHGASDITTLVSQQANPDFAARQAAYIPSEDDTLLFGFDNLPLQLLVSMHRPSSVPAAQREWVYSQSGAFAALPGVTDPTTRLTTFDAADARASWNPHTDAADLPARQFHYRSEELAASGAIATWPDVSGQSRDAANVTLAQQPQVSGTLLGGAPVAIFDGGDSLATASLAALHETEATLFILFLNPAGGSETLLSQEDTSARRRFHIHPRWGDGNLYADWGDSASNRMVLANSPFTGASWHLLTVRRSGTADGKIWRNGSLLLTDTALGTPAAFTANAPLRIGADSGGNNFTGSVAVILGYAAALSDAQRERVEGAILWRYGLQTQLPAAHAYRSAAPRVGAPPASRVSVTPPADWALSQVLGAGGVQHSRYWLGLRQTADAAEAILPENVTVRALVADDGAGVPADAAAYTNIAVVCQPAPAQAMTLLVVNLATGRVAPITVPAGQRTARASAALSGGAIGDPIAVVHAGGSEMDDGAVYIW